MSASELILNPDGSVYHLGLRPEHVAPLVVTVGDPERVSAVSAHFDVIDFRQNRREFCTHVGRFARRRIMCISTGIGTDNVDIVLNELDALVNVDLHSGEALSQKHVLTFVRLGTSGTFQADIPVDTLLGSAGAVGVDGLGPFYPFARYGPADTIQQLHPAFAAAAYGASGDEGLLATWLNHQPDYRRGLTLTCAGFYGPQRRSLRLPFRGPSLAALADIQLDGEDERFTNFEMETAGLYGLSDLLGHRALSLSAILANRATGRFSSTPTATVERLISEFFSCLRAHPSVFYGG